MKNKIAIGVITLILLIAWFALNVMKETGTMIAGKHYDSKPISVIYSVNDVIEKAKKENYSVRYGSAYGGPYEYFNWNEKSQHVLYGYKEDYISLTISNENYWFLVGPSEINTPSNRQVSVKFVPLKDIVSTDAQAIVVQELKNININVRGALMWDTNKGYQPPEFDKRL